MDKKDRKSLQLEYKERDIIGGVYAIKNNENGKMLILSTLDLQGIKNRFGFFKKTDSCLHMKLQKDWAQFGKNCFSLEVLEELKKKEEQTPKEFKDDLQVLEEMWIEKFDQDILY